jgi:hypothetical protein
VLEAYGWANVGDVKHLTALDAEIARAAVKNSMNSPCRHGVALLLVLLLGPFHVIGQVADVPRAWLGVWKLNPQQSSFDERAPVVVQGQTLTIEASGDALTVTGNTTLRDGRRIPEVVKINLNAEPTMSPGGVVTVFKAIDRSTFDIIVTLTSPAIGEARGVNRFVFSPDGRSLVETKTQTRRAAVPAGQAGPTGAETATVTSVLVFERQE